MEVCRDVLSRLVSIFGTPPFMYLLLFQNKDESFVFGNFYFIFWRQAESFLETFDVRSRQPGFISVNAQFLPIYLQFYITVFFAQLAMAIITLPSFTNEVARMSLRPVFTGL